MSKEGIQLEWQNERPEGVDQVVIDDIATNLSGKLSSPEQLRYHTVFLGDEMKHDTPGVTVEGKKGSKAFVCTYYPAIGEAFTNWNGA